MHPRVLIANFILLAASATVALGKLSDEQLKALPAPAARQIDFSKDIKPIFEKSCVNCHGRGRAKGDFALDDRATFLKGGDSGAPVVAGKSAESLLIELVMGFNSDSVMPQKGTKLTHDQIALLRAWIDQGAKWDEGVWLGKVEAQNLNPREPDIPANKKFSNPIDRFIGADFQKNKIKWPDTVNDRVFARRVWLDIVGLLPPSNDLERFVSDRRADKRERLVRQLLDDHRNYADHWLTFWNDMLRNDYKGTGYIDGGRKQISQWLYSALETNMPYNQFVAQLVNPLPESEGFIKGIVWRGVVNGSQTPEMQAAQSISQVFMGLNLKCASCHDSFVNDWQLSDAYALANVFAEQPLEIYECDKPLGKKAKMQFLYPQFGEIDPAAARSNRLEQLAACVTSPDNGRLTRTFVNRLWGKFFGRALVEPVDDMEKKAWNPDLLDWLAEDFVKHGYDVKHLIARIVTSRAYQLESVGGVEREQNQFVFRGPQVRRLSAEQFRDALGFVTGVWYAEPAAPIISAQNSSPKHSSVPARWIWKSAEPAQPSGQNIFLRKSVHLDSIPTSALAFVAGDNSYILFVNGKRVKAIENQIKVDVVDIRKQLVKGENIISVNASNTGTEPNPAGFYLYAFVRENRPGKAPRVMDFYTDETWLWSEKKTADWQKSPFNPTGWKNAATLGEAGAPPWNLGKEFSTALALTDRFGKVRAALTTADPLQIALGRPNREQVITSRETAATTLQALELTNGSTLAQLLKQGAQQLAQSESNGDTLVKKLFSNSLGREASRAELRMARELVGQPTQPDGVEDLLWSLAMLPEFQLIY